jgi:hypothetical protein
MAENDDPTTEPDEGVPAPAEPAAEQTTVSNEAAPVATPGPRFTDRVWNFRAMVAVALAALLLGGGLGAAIAAVSHDDGPDRHPGFMRWQGGPDGPGGPFMGPGPNGFDPGQRKQFRQDLKNMREKMRERMKEQQATPTPAPTTPSPSSNG